MAESAPPSGSPDEPEGPGARPASPRPRDSGSVPRSGPAPGKEDHRRQRTGTGEDSAHPPSGPAPRDAAERTGTGRDIPAAQDTGPAAANTPAPGPSSPAEGTEGLADEPRPAPPGGAAPPPGPGAADPGGASASPPPEDAPVGSGSSAEAAVSVEDSLRFAFGTLTVLPVGAVRWDRAAARGGMLWAPLVGLAVGVAAALVGGLLLLLGTGALLAAVASVAVPAVLTRGLHLDGLADTADGLGSAKPAPAALRLMKQSDIGPFGVLTLVLVLLAQVAVLARLYGDSWAQGALAAAVSGTVARLAMTLAAREGVPAARAEGLGAVVASVAPARTALFVAGGVFVAAAGAGVLSGGGGALRCALAVVVGCAAAELLLRRCLVRFGGVTGDVFGGLAETAGTASLVVLALGSG
ncbi:adenosylcobinamide-GDP ribazoletransferase [Streptomyces sp. LD120]|uniref:Adenosylcobinamide-GDP ribazoletransferase n=1 Tax=Streptomyces physcomitrii TaxID=2724184 RepID=A0ABX1H2H0_9ACTN|nr:adenosylcobinamide-GDP ribazoletransferase [Streptomyces physcomitrii]